MLSSLRLAHPLCSPQLVNIALRRTRLVPRNQLTATSSTIRYASSRPKGKDKAAKNGDDPTKESKPKEKLKSTASLIPGSQQPIVDEAAREEYAKAESTMHTSVEWFRKECTEAGSRANGRITPALLKPVRVKMAGVEGTVCLDQVATVGVREGTTLIVTVFDETMVKEVERGIYEAKIPHVVPQKYDNRTIKIPIPKPTVETRIAEYTAQHQKAEDMRVQIRKAFQASVKRGKYGKHSVELTEFQKLSDRYISEVDQILANLKKATGAK
ncbi:hypothetical protein AX14_009423 [Amanita brunnescens Koide BX004]|nr:hypothetical protein AX14_011476 [Amanita brunnescens Koide BX004]KAF8723194.1 hypothetical protein AX14_009423 [Amanita brunnescens Koide BX004]